MTREHEDRVRVPDDDLKQSPERWPGESFDLLTAFLSNDPASHAGAVTFARLTDSRRLAGRISDAARRWGMNEEQTIAVLTAYYVGIENGKAAEDRQGEGPLPDWQVFKICRDAAEAAGRGKKA